MRIKNILLFIIAAFMLLENTANAKEKDSNTNKKEEGYNFTIIKDIPCSPVENQYSSGTCWVFSGLSFFESEMMRLNKPFVNLSEMFVVWHAYNDKAEKMIRMHGHTNFSAGGAFHDVSYVIKKYGIVPESVYSGLNYGENKHIHGEMNEVLKDQVNGILKNKNKKLSTVWKKVINETLSTYLGEIPDNFEYKGEEYTPKSFAKDYVGLNMDDYVEVTSFTHHPYYQKFILEVPDNWLWGEVYNVPLDDMMSIIDNSVDNGYTVAWASDVSEKGFSSSKDGVAVVPVVDTLSMSDTELTKWNSLPDSKKNAKLYSLKKPGKEKKITAEIRQKAFDDYETTDDHGLQIVGTAKDQNGTLYYKVKNSWGDYNKYKGFFFASHPFVRYKTTSIMVNKNAIPLEIKGKLGF